MTPWQLGVYIEAYRERERLQYNVDASLMYYGAIIPLMKKVPPLGKFLTAKQTVEKKGGGHIMWAYLQGVHQRQQDDHSSTA